MTTQPHVNDYDQATAEDLGQDKSTELETALAHFHGSEEIYHNGPFFKNYCYTEGMRYLAKEAGAYWLLDAVASHHVKPLPYFLIWRIERHAETPEKAEHWKLTAREDTNEPNVVCQEIPFSDFPLDCFEFYQVRIDDKRWLSMLKNEY